MPASRLKYAQAQFFELLHIGKGVKGSDCLGGRLAESAPPLEQQDLSRLVGHLVGDGPTETPAGCSPLRLSPGLPLFFHE